MDRKLSKVLLFVEIVNVYFKFTKALSELKPVTVYRLLKEFDQLNYKYYLSSFYGILNGYNIDKLKLYQQFPPLTDERIKIIKDIQLESHMVKEIFPYKENREELINSFERIPL
ncbi:hypothetical protein [Peribacillus simplex]|uniref:hypothetical protein n=1 Tax=Peribacillus simplex TaxID=1478 RepID=UPI0011DDC113|nr:hypothetical protein [Peribacillus simplex]